MIAPSTAGEPAPAGPGDRPDGNAAVATMPTSPQPTGPQPTSTQPTSTQPTDTLPGWRSPLVVVAHPDDESFGLGAVLDEFVRHGARPTVLCFTHGEASTLHGVDGDLRRIRSGELETAAGLLGLAGVDLRDEADGGLADAAPQRLTRTVLEVIGRTGADGLIAFDLTGVTGHPDHIAATTAAMHAGRSAGLPVLGWTLSNDVADALNEEFGAGFGGRPAEQIHLTLQVRRETQLAAVRAHPSQAVPGSVLWRRLDLLGDREYLTWLVPPAPDPF